MSRGLAVALTAGAGVLVGMQAPINARLGRSVGSLQAASFSFIVGTVALVTIAAFSRQGLGTSAMSRTCPGGPWSVACWERRT